MPPDPATAEGRGRLSDSSPAAGALTAGDVARITGGELRGDPLTVVHGVAPLERAGPDELSFFASPRYAAAFGSSEAGIVLIAPELADTTGKPPVRVVVAKPHEAVLDLLPALYQPPLRLPGVHPTAVLGRGVRLGSDVLVGAHAVIGDHAVLGDRSWIGEHCSVGAGVNVGADSHLYPNVTMYPGSSIGERVSLHAGVRLGSDGFGYVYRGGEHAKIPHIGRCVVGDDVEIGANTTIDRGSIDDTVIGSGTKIDNLVHIGHNVRIGRLCLVMAQVGIAGSARLGDGCIVAGQAGINGHVTIGDGARIAGQAGVFSDVPAGETWSGYPARPHRESLRATAALHRLPAAMRDIERLAKDRS